MIESKIAVGGKALPKRVDKIIAQSYIILKKQISEYNIFLSYFIVTAMFIIGAKQYKKEKQWKYVDLQIRYFCHYKKLNVYEVLLLLKLWST